MASTRIRVYDPVLWFANDKQFVVELFNPRKTYDIVIFQKYFDDDAFALAQKLKKQGTAIVLDMNVNYYDSGSSYIEEGQREQVDRFTKLADHVIAASEYLKQVIENRYAKKPVSLIEEAIPEKYFATKNTPRNPPKKFLWVGFKWKVKELEVLKDVLSLIAFDCGVSLRTIGGTKVDVGDMQVDMQQYREWSVQKKMSGCDIFLAPRDVNDPYNKAHTFTKIGGAMAMGIPVVASPVPSYERSPAVICKTTAEWQQTLASIAAGEHDLEELSKRGIEYVWNNYRPQKIKADYVRLFEEIVKV